MRQIPNFVLRMSIEELQEAHEWLRTIRATEKKAIRDETPSAVTYWMERADEVLYEVMQALAAFDIEVNEDTTRPEAFRIRPAPEADPSEASPVFCTKHGTPEHDEGSPRCEAMDG